jgi:chemotaxis protein CheX
MRDVEIATYFVNATVVTMFKMANLVVSSGRFFVKHDKTALGEITAIIGVSGERNGSIAVSFSRESAEALVRGMLGDNVEDLERDMVDAVGELTNIISGHARKSIASAGLSLSASNPSIVVGEKMEIEHKAKAAVIVIPFNMSGKSFVVEFCLEGL